MKIIKGTRLTERTLQSIGFKRRGNTFTAPPPKLKRTQHNTISTFLKGKIPNFTIKTKKLGAGKIEVTSVSGVHGNSISIGIWKKQ